MNILFIAQAAKSADTLPAMHIVSTESSFEIARMLMIATMWIENTLYLDHNATCFTTIYAILVFLLSFVVGYIAKWIIVGCVRIAGKKLNGELYHTLIQKKFFIKFCRIIPAIVFLILIQFTLISHDRLAYWLTKLTWVYIIIITANAINTLIQVAWIRFNDQENKRKLPLKGLVELAKGLIWLIATIVCVSIIVDRSPTALLAGLTAFAAVLMLVFKDSILGVVAGVQLSQNDSLHLGDWIATGNANGTVIEVSLTSVKIRNWDLTVTTVPPYSLITNGFTNYRPMQESKTRRICRSYMIDADSVVPATDEMLAEFAKIDFMSDWIAKKIEQRKAGREYDTNNPAGLVDGSIDTNLGVFRAYMKLYLDNNPEIAPDNGTTTCFVTTLAQTSAGIPLQIYCFTATSAWTAYEAIQAAVFEHTARMLYKFNLYTFENPSGRDTLIDGYLSPGKNPDAVFGLPFPFFSNDLNSQSPYSSRYAQTAPAPSAVNKPAQNVNTGKTDANGSAV